jgi:predicted peroxiredoxin
VTRSLIVKATAGADDPERCAQAFTVAAVAAVSGTPTSLWLTGEAAWLAVPDRAEAFVLPHSTPLPELIADILDLGSLTVCSQCAARRNLVEKDLLPGTTISGAASFVAAITQPQAQAVVY